jgi:hypothetical protein
LPHFVGLESQEVARHKHKVVWEPEPEPKQIVVDRLLEVEQRLALTVDRGGGQVRSTAASACGFA